MEKLVCKKQNKSVISFILSELGELNYSSVQKLLRKKDIKINGVRIKADCAVDVGDQIEVFAPIKQSSKEIEILYADDNMIVVNKPANIEVVSDSEDDLVLLLKKQLEKPIFAVHRLDRNTSGLVVFALNEQTKNELELAFKNHTINKYYLAVVVGKPTKSDDKLVAYHKKDSQKSICYISDTPKPGYSKIITSYKVLKTNDILSLLEVEIETGKTHQIRAHLAHIGYPILGDEKYGDKQINKQFKKKKQMLTAYKLEFNIQNQHNSNIIVKKVELPNVINKLSNALFD